MKHSTLCVKSKGVLLKRIPTATFDVALISFQHVTVTRYKVLAGNTLDSWGKKKGGRPIKNLQIYFFFQTEMHGGEVLLRRG